MKYLPFLSVLFLFACNGNKPAATDDGKLQVVATTGMVADIVKVVGGDRVSVEALMGPGVDPHLYKASPGDVAKLTKADAVFYNGLHLEGKMADILEQVGKKKPVLAIAQETPEDLLLDSINYQGFPDPHIWFDVSIWRQTLDPVVAQLTKLDPDGAELFKANAEEYDKQLTQLHESVIAAIGEIPKSQRVMITAHDAFRYFGRAYDIEVLGIQGISTESEAGVKEINDLVRVIVDRGVKAVFVESSVSQKNVQALVEGARAKGANVKIGGQLYSDALGDEGTPEGTYLGMFRHNVKTLVEALK